jgi:hypothetical protein
MRYMLRARVSTDDPVAVAPVLSRLIPQGTIARSEDGHEFVVTGEFDGPSARDLNRSLLSELRRAEKRTRLRAEWTSRDTTERFFDYVPKGARRAEPGQAGTR